SAYIPKVVKLHNDSGYTNKIMVGGSNMNIDMQYNGAGTGTDILYWTTLKLR
ncbi:unnamed protein product, partial [marine sediment metagenome]